MIKEHLGALVYGYFAGTDVRVDDAFTLLPPLRPKPALVGRNRQRRTEFKHAVGAFNELNLSAGLVQMQPTPDLGRKRNNPARLNPDISVVTHEFDSSSKTA